MQFHYEQMLERRFEADQPKYKESPAWMIIFLIKSLKDWFGQPQRIFSQNESTQLQLGYEVLAAPVMEFAQAFGPLVYEVQQTWPVQIFGMADNNELVELSFSKDGATYMIGQRSISGTWWENLSDLYLCIDFPDSMSTNCMKQILNAVKEEIPTVALGWDSADFLKQQALTQIDRTLSFCYVSFDPIATQEDPTAYLAGLTLEQKGMLWCLFLKMRLLPPEFEWLRDAWLQNRVPKQIEWHLSLYCVLEQLGIRFICSGNKFELIDGEGNRIYFGVDHYNAAEQVLMKLLFPLNQ